MTRRQAGPPAPGPLEDDAARFDDLFDALAQRRSFRAYLPALRRRVGDGRPLNLHLRE